ncbi:hypothetical protein ACFV0C_10940 [Streptomyces sp. NPDC059568]|uniref:hypothetical protein n=1 Tax=Streptomyces sp. NPDC059568 TaxID=3346868 RepID=UPI0036A96720
MTKKKDTVKAAKDAVRRDSKDTKSATRSQGLLVDRYVRHHTPDEDRDDNQNNNSDG